MVSSLPWWVQAVFLVGIALSVIGFGYRYGYRHGPGFIACIERLDGRWRLETGTGVACRGQLTGGYAHPLLVILNFRLESGDRRSVTLLSDSADGETLRRLRVWLRTRRDADEDLDPP